MRNINILLVTLCILFTSSFCYAQRVWTLEECIEYAKEYNINIQQRAVQIKLQELALNTSRNVRLPELSANIAEQFSFGNYNATTGTMVGTNGNVNNDLAYTTGQIVASVQLFDGLKTQNQIKVDEFTLEATTANLERAQKDISVQVATYYIRCLYYKGLVDVVKSQVETSQQMLNRAVILFDEGKRPRSEVADAEAQLAIDQYALVDAEGQSTLARLTLSQLLNLPAENGFDVTDVSDESLTFPSSAQSLYNDNVELFPSILAAKAQLKANEYESKVAKSGYYPTLSLRGSINSFYVNMFNQKNQWGGFGNQFKNNLNEVIGLHLSIPIFDRFQTRNNIRRTKLDRLIRTLALDDARQSYLQEIEQAYYNATRVRSKQFAADRAVQACQISVEYEQERYNAGRSNLFDLQQAHQKLVKAQQDLLQAKFEYQIRQRILHYYQN